MSSNSVANAQTMNKLQVLEDTIDRYYLERVWMSRHWKKACMTAWWKPWGSLYSTYYSSEELKELQDKTEGIYYGIGAYVAGGGSVIRASVRQFGIIPFRTEPNRAGGPERPSALSA